MASLATSEHYQSLRRIQQEYEHRRRIYLDLIKKEIKNGWKITDHFRREFNTVEAYKKHAETRAEVAALVANKDLHPSSAAPELKGAVRISADAWDMIRHVGHPWSAKLACFRRLGLTNCSLCNHHIAHQGTYYSSRSYSHVCTHCHAAGAVQFEGTWYASAEARDAANKAQDVWVLSGEKMEKERMSERGQAQLTKMAEQQDGLPILYRPGSLRLDYHSGVESPNLGGDSISVGIELELNKGSVQSRYMDEVIAKILLATGHKVKVERDSSVTAFEIISGYGAPSALRSSLAPIFAQDLLKGLRTGPKTGAHVHVTNPWICKDAHGNVEANTAVNEVKPRLDSVITIYEQLAARNYNSYARRGMASTRYNAIADRDNTIEFRLFKMQTKLGRLMRNAQFAWSTIKGIRDLEDKFSLASWLNWIADQPREETFELRAWLASEGHKVPHVAKDFRKFYKDLGISSALV